MISLLAAVTLIPSLAQDAVPATPAGNRLKTFVEALNTGKEDQFVSFVKENLVESMWKDSLELWKTRLTQAHNSLAPIKLLKLVEADPHHIVFTVENKAKAPLAVRIDVEKSEPHRIELLLISEAEKLKDKPAPKVYEWTTTADLAKQILANRKAPAIAIAYASGDEPMVVEIQGVREIGKEAPASKEDRWLVGSIGKSMTSSLIGSLIEKGVLRWDMTLSEALPNVKMLDEYKAVTIEQVMQHRSGLPQDSTFNMAAILRVVKGEKDPLKIRANYAADMLQRPPIAKAGAAMLYSNAGYSLLGHIAELKSGKPFEALLKEHVFDPIGMKSAMAGQPGDPGNPGSDGQPKGHVMTPSGPRPMSLNGPITPMAAPAGAGITCTIADLCLYAQAHLKGLRGKDTFLKATTIQRLHTPLNPHEANAYASGWGIAKGLTPEPFHGHNGSDGTMISEMAIWPNQNLAIVSIANAGILENPTPPMEAILAIEKRLRKD